MGQSKSDRFLVEQNPARLDIQAVNISYGNISALENLTFQVPHGERIAVVGPNGAGKSTLFKALVGLLPISKGQVFIHGLPLGHHLDCVAYVPQREEVDWSFPVSVRDVVMMGRAGHQGWLRPPSRNDQMIVDDALAQMGLTDLGKRSIGDLSGGQQQRVFLARALAQEPHILLMDEPFNGIDAPTREVVLTLLEDLRNRSVTVMVSTHDLSMAAQRFDKVLLLNRRLVAFGVGAEVFTQENVRAGFGGQVLDLNGSIVIDQCCPGEEHVH